MGFYNEMAQELKKAKSFSKDRVNKLKIKLSKKYHLPKIPTDIEIMINAEKKDLPLIKRFLLTKPVRTLSGVSAVAIMTKPFKCPHEKKGIGPCIQCPGGPSSKFGSVPQSYTGKEPATLRAIRAGYNPYLQVFNRLEQYMIMGHDPEKVELIIMGGTFPSYPKSYQDSFVMNSLKAMNDFSALFYSKTGIFDMAGFKEFFLLPGNVKDRKRTAEIQQKLRKLENKGKTSLEKEQKKNEKSVIRCVGMTIETRPDYATIKEANQMLKLGTTRVELGVQTVFNDILKKIRRGHTIEDSIEATRTLRDLGFKINYHMMPGLPGSSKEKDIYSLNILFQNQLFQPDMLKIYPCMVIEGTKLYDMWKKGKYTPLTAKQAADIIVAFKKNVPEYCRIMRINRDIPTYMTSAGIEMTNLRQYVDKLMKKKGIKCKCIRCREIKSDKPKKIEIKATAYPAGHGTEFFIQAVTPDDKIVGFCRLRFPSQFLRDEITKDSALIRELHVYGPALALERKIKNKKAKRSSQHAGVGKMLMQKAEELAKTYFRDKMVVISGIGAREYYKRLGYRREGPYMVKNI